MQRKIIIKGALILTFTGLVTRVIGFFYRIYLSRSFGEEGVGLYQLIFPVYALAVSISCAGIQTAISRCTARSHVQNKNQKSACFLYVGMAMSLFASIIIVYLMQHYAKTIAASILQEERCEFLLTAASYAIPFSAIHSCICGYYLGLKQTQIPAISQLIEQIARVCFVYIFCSILLSHAHTPNIGIAAAGLAAGEFCSMCYSFFMLRFRHHIFLQKSHTLLHSLIPSVKELLTFAVPLTANRILLNTLQSVESISIPLQLQNYGMPSGDALRTYGVLTGMALPLILFPTALSNSISSLTLPAISEMQVSGNQDRTRHFVSKLCICSLLLGSLCSTAFLFFGHTIGNLLFQSPLAGNFITTLAWICPFLYTNSILASIINGLGKPLTAFRYHALHLLIRIIGIFLFVPKFGIQAYLCFLLTSQLCLFLLSIRYLYRFFNSTH